MSTLKQRLTASERKWPVRWAEVRGEERMASLRTSAWEATISLHCLFFDNCLAMISEKRTFRMETTTPEIFLISNCTDCFKFFQGYQQFEIIIAKTRKNSYKFANKHDNICITVFSWRAGKTCFFPLLNPFWNHCLSLQCDWLSAVRFIHESDYLFAPNRILFSANENGNLVPRVSHLR